MILPKYQPKKSLGQNFLTDRRIQEKIIQACDLNPEDTVIEIGPGQGVLTQLIAPLVKKLICVEADRDLIEPLRTSVAPNVDILHADFLKWDFNDKGTVPFKVIGNIPYYISTPIVEKLIANRDNIKDAFLTVQLEFGERLAAKPGGKEYGSLTCFVQYYADVKLLFKIKNTSFKPAPKVDSCFLHLKMRPPAIKASDEEFLFQLVQTAFSQRRKNIVNALKGLVEREKLETALKQMSIDLNSRPENLTLSNYITLSNLLML